MDNTEIVSKIAQALYHKTWPAYKFETQDESTKFAWLDQAEQLVRTLGEGGLIITVSDDGWLSERDNIVTILKDLCNEFGDNNWQSHDHLGDIIEKHLGKHLWAKQKKVKA